MNDNVVIKREVKLHQFLCLIRDARPTHSVSRPPGTAMELRKWVLVWVCEMEDDLDADAEETSSWPSRTATWVSSEEPRLGKPR